MSKKVLVLGGTGAMGVYLVPELALRGYKVDVVSLDKVESDNPNITYITENAKDDTYLQELLRNKYDAIVDYMIYSTAEFSKRYEILLNSTEHYIFLSTYRIYAGDSPITENSPRLLDISQDKDYLATAENEYSLYKALEEDILRRSSYNNYSIVRPAITYSKRRFQLVTLEANVVVYRAMKKLPIFLPYEALAVRGTMNWAGDVAKMFTGIILNPASYKETFTFATAENHSWEEIANYYKEIIGLEYIAVDTETYLKFFGSTAGARYQLMYDRCFNRIVDNSKILRIAGLNQAEFMPLKNGLARELSALPKDIEWGKNSVNDRMDAYLYGNK